MTISEDPVDLEVMNAQREFPEMVGGIGRLNTSQMQAVDGLFMKDGAEGVEVLTLADGRSLALKISDGSARAIPTVVAAVLKEWGVSISIDPIKVMGGANVVGEMRAVL